MDRTYVFLCLASDFKGGAFLRQLKHLGHMVFLVTSEKTREEAWPLDDLEDIFFMPGRDGRKWDNVRNGTKGAKDEWIKG